MYYCKMKLTFDLQKEFIELNKLLKVLNLAETGGHANLLIDEGLVRVNSHKETQRRKKIRKGDVVQFEATTITVE